MTVGVCGPAMGELPMELYVTLRTVPEHLRGIARSHLSGGRCCVDDHPEWLDGLLRAVLDAYDSAAAVALRSLADAGDDLADLAPHYATGMRTNEELTVGNLRNVGANIASIARYALAAAVVVPPPETPA